MEAIFFAIYYKCDYAFYDQLRYIPHTFEAWTLVAECAAANLRAEYLIAIMLRCPAVAVAMPAALCRKVDPVLRYAADIFGGAPSECVQRALGFACRWQYAGLIRDTLALGADATPLFPLCATEGKFTSMRALAAYGEIRATPAQVAGLYDRLLRRQKFLAARIVARTFCIPEDPVAAAMCNGTGDCISQLRMYRTFVDHEAKIASEWWFPLFRPSIRQIATFLGDEATMRKLQEPSA